MIKFIKHVIRFLRNHHIDLGNQQKKHWAIWMIILIVKIPTVAFQHFSKRQGAIHATALTYFTLLSLVPILAMVFGIAQGFGLKDMADGYIRQLFPQDSSIASALLEFTDNALANANPQGSLIAGIGLLVLVWSALMVLSNIERAFNYIWQIPKNRTIDRKIIEYSAILFLTPILFLLSNAVLIFATQILNDHSHIIPASGVWLKLLSYFLIWVLFTMIYLYMPNKRVIPLAAFIGGIAGGTLYILLQATYIYFQSAMTSYNVIYGSFAAIPLFLIWLRTCWLIVLYGVEVSSLMHNELEKGKSQSKAE